MFGFEVGVVDEIVVCFCGEYGILFGVVEDFRVGSE